MGARGTQIKVNGTDIYTAYGAYLLEGGLNSLIQWPAAKTVTDTSWQEKDGSDPDLEALSLDTRTVSLPFALRGGTAKIAAFYAFIAASPYTEWEFADIALKRRLRVTGVSSLDAAEQLQLMTVTLADDTPWGFSLGGQEWSYSAPAASGAAGGYAIDGRPLADYGVTVAGGTLSSVIAPADVKPLLSRDISFLDGVLYDGQKAESQPGNTFASRPVTLKGMLKAVSATAALKNWYALLHDLTKADMAKTDRTRRCARTLAADGLKLSCWYKSSSVNGFYPSRTGGCWIDFKITLCVFNS